jgi:hypothetical protein
MLERKWMLLLLGMNAFVPVGFVSAQWLHYPVAGAPRASGGKINLAASAPRGRDGKPDLSGIWAPQPSTVPEILASVPGSASNSPPPLGSEPITKYFANIFADFKPDATPLKSGITLRTDDPALHCLPTGMPMFDTYPLQRKIVQTPGLILLLSENDDTFRQIFTDGRPFPAELEPSWLGSSLGRWEGDALVVETAGLNGRSSLDLMGHTHSDQLRVTERFHRVNFGTIDFQMTLDDPQTFTRPFTVRFNLILLPDSDLLESFCSENEKDHSHATPH